MSILLFSCSGDDGYNPLGNPGGDTDDGDDTKEFRWSRSELECEVNCIHDAGLKHKGIEENCESQCGKSCWLCERSADRGEGSFESCAYEDAGVESLDGFG